jgi:hypothetical protein
MHVCLTRCTASPAASANKIHDDSEHFILGHWIHVASDMTAYRPCQVGESLEIRGVPMQKFMKKGHEFVVLDILMLTGGEVVQRVKHTCIFRPRQSQHTTS